MGLYSFYNSLLRVMNVCCIGPNRSVAYVCCRDGSKKEVKNRHPNKTGQVRKHVGTRKLGNFCISRIMATEYLETGRVNVTYISSHTNHLLGIKECKYLPLPPSVKKYIQQQFAAGVTLDRVINGIAIASLHIIVATTIIITPC